MKALRILIASVSLFVFSSSFTSRSIDYVYVCDSKTSVAYHQTKTCRGLNRCTHTIIKVTKTEATDTYFKRACKVCY